MANDLTSLFKPSDRGPSAQVRQGVVESWDPNTGANSVRVAGGVLLNVTASKAGAATMKVGDTVLLLSAGNKWVLLGTATTPGDPGTVPTWNVDITALTGQVDTITTVTIPAVQNDVAIVQGDVIELNTVTVPAAQASADAAQSTADTAQSTATSAASDAATAVDTANTAATAASDAASAASTAQAAADAAQADVDAVLPITETKISDDAITTPKIAAGAITAVKIAADTITAAQISASAITASELAANAVTAGKIAAGTIVAADIASGTITATQIAANTITAAKIAAGTITGTELSATSIDGKTITGALFRTAASGQRIEIDSATRNEVQCFSGAASETAPGYLKSDLVSGGAFTTISSPEVAGVTGTATLNLQVIPSLGAQQAILSANNVTLSAGAWARLQAGSHIFQLDATGALALDGSTVLASGATGNVPQPVLSFSATDITSISSTSFIPGTPVVGIAFTAPATGAVYIVTSGHMASASTANSYIYLSPEVRTGSTVGSGTVVHAASTDEGVATGQADTNITRINAGNEILVTGLTPGASYNVRLVYLITAGTVGAIFYRAVLVKPVL